MLGDILGMSDAEVEEAAKGSEVRGWGAKAHTHLAWRIRLQVAQGLAYVPPQGAGRWLSLASTRLLAMVVRRRTPANTYEHRLAVWPLMAIVLGLLLFAFGNLTVLRVLPVFPAKAPRIALRSLRRRGYRISLGLSWSAPPPRHQSSPSRTKRSSRHQD